MSVLLLPRELRSPAGSRREHQASYPAAPCDLGGAHTQSLSLIVMDAVFCPPTA